MSEHLGDRIRELRDNSGMSGVFLAKKAKLSRHQLYMIETGRTSEPSALLVLRIAKVLGVSTDYLLEGREAAKQPTLV